jgi:3-hexulose-6-phosphate synthase
MNVLLQVALDVVHEDSALRIAETVAPSVDRIEIGTPLLLSSGSRIIGAIRELVPDAVIVADCKMMDCGVKLADLMMASGADGLIVQGAAPLATLRAASATVEQHAGFMMVDDLGVEDLARLRSKLGGLRVSELIVHTGKDEQAEGRTPADRLREAADLAGLPPLAVAGGIDDTNLSSIVDGVGPAVVIVGEAIYDHVDPASVASAMREALNRLPAGRTAAVGG